MTIHGQSYLKMGTASVVPTVTCSFFNQPKVPNIIEFPPIPWLFGGNLPDVYGS